MNVNTLADTLANSPMCYLMATCIYMYQEIQFKGNLDGMCEYIYWKKVSTITFWLFIH